MDLKLIGATATTQELAVIEGVVPSAETVEVPGRVVRTERTSLRHLLLPALDAVQSAVGYLSPGAVDAIAVRLHLPPAEIYSVASFYALLRTKPGPPRMAHMCDDIACRVAGGADLIAALADREDVQASPCLGQCERRPAVFIQRADETDLVIGQADAEKVVAALDKGWEPPAVDPASAAPQTAGRRVLRRVGRVDPTSLDSYRANGGYGCLSAALGMGPEGVLSAIEISALKGRGGAAFLTGIKWRSVMGAAGPKYVICNADESEPGNFKDRVLLEGDPFAVIESMTIAGYTVGANKGFIYVRGEYSQATALLSSALEQARQAGMLGTDLMGSGFDFDIELRRGQGAYICGEETALMNSIEGYRGEPRQKPPFPTEVGLFGMPTVINNVETFMTVFHVLADAGRYAARGTSESTGTRLFSISGDVARPGVYEAEFGVSLRQIIDEAGGTVGELGFVLLGGAAGSLVGPDGLDLSLTLEDTRAAGLSLGSGVVMVFNRVVDMRDIIRRITRFFRDESCGQCVPCRVGTVRVEEAVARADGWIEADLIDEMDRAMKDASICGLGHTAASVVQSAIALGILGDRR